MTALALTDHGNMYGSLEFYQKCEAAGIKPIIGYEAYVAPGSRTDKTAGTQKTASHHLTLLAMNETGFRNLMVLSTRAFKEGFYYKPRVDKEPFNTTRGYLPSGCLGGTFPNTFWETFRMRDRAKGGGVVSCFGDRSISNCKVTVWKSRRWF